jgi:hypothetical protein
VDLVADVLEEAAPVLLAAEEPPLEPDDELGEVEEPVLPQAPAARHTTSARHARIEDATVPSQRKGARE